MKPMTEEQSKAYRAYRQSGGTATMRAWLEQQGRGGPQSARAQGTQRGRRLPWAQPAAGTIPANVGDRVVKPEVIGMPGGTPGPTPAPPPNERIDPIVPTPASAKTGARPTPATKPAAIAGGGKGKEQADTTSGGKPAAQAGTPVKGSGGSGGLPSGYSYDPPKGRMYTAEEPPNGQRWAYGPNGERVAIASSVVTDAASGGKPGSLSGGNDRTMEGRYNADGSVSNSDGLDPVKGSGAQSGGKPGTPAPASTTAPVDQGTGNDAGTAQLSQVQQRATLWERRLAELEQAVISGQASHTDYMREQQRFEAFMAAAESGDYAGAMAAQNPFDGGAGANAAPQRDLAQINAERARNGLSPLSQDVYEVMPERGAQQAARSYGDQGGQILSNEYASESQMSSTPRMSQIIAGAGGDPAEIQRRMQAMGSTSVIDDVSGMTAEQLAGNRYGAAIEDWRRQNAPASASPSSGQAPAVPASGGKPGGPVPASPGAAKMGDPEPMPVTVGGGTGAATGGGFGAAQDIAPASGQIVQPPVETKPQAPREINPVGGPKPATNPNPRLPPIPMAGGKPPGTDPMEPPTSGATGARPIGGQIVRPPDPRPQGRASYMEMRNGMAGKPPESITPTQPPSGKMLGNAVTSAADIMRNAGAGISNGIKGAGGMISSGLGGIKNMLTSGAGAVGSAIGGALQPGSSNPSATPANASANITGAPQAPGATRGGSGDFNAGGGLTQTGQAAFQGAQISQNQQRSREQAVAAIQNFRGMR